MKIIELPELSKSLSEDDPIVSPYPQPFIFLADRAPTEDEPAVYRGYAGLVLLWVDTISNDLYISTDNLDPTLGWRQIPLISGQTVHEVMLSNITKT